MQWELRHTLDVFISEAGTQSFQLQGVVHLHTLQLLRAAGSEVRLHLKHTTIVLEQINGT